MEQLLFRMISEIIFVIIAMSVLVYCVIKRIKLISLLEVKEDIILKIICGIGLIWLFWVGVRPICLDIPLYLNNDFEIVEGVVQNDSNKRGVNKRINIIDTKGNKIRVDVSYMPNINKDDKIVVKYMKHSMYGILLERNGKEILY